MKIFREDELETELERCRSELAALRGGKTSNGPSMAPPPPRPRPVSATDEPCELCGEAGHDLEHCPIFAGPDVDSPSTRAPASRCVRAVKVVADRWRSTGEPFCSDCESYGHTPEECPSAEECF